MEIRISCGWTSWLEHRVNLPSYYSIMFDNPEPTRTYWACIWNWVSSWEKQTLKVDYNLVSLHSSHNPRSLHSYSLLWFSFLLKDNGYQQLLSADDRVLKFFFFFLNEINPYIYLVRYWNIVTSFSNPFALRGDQQGISPYNINTFSTRYR